MGRHHKPNRERGNCAGNRARIARIGSNGEIRRGEVVSESLDQERTANAKAPGIVVYLKDADSANRRQLRRFISQCGMTEHVCQWIQSRKGERIPLALEISGSQTMIDALTAWIESAENTIIIRWHHVLDAPAFVSGIGATSLDNCSENALRVIKRKYLRKEERAARYERESRNYGSDCKRFDVELKTSHGIADGEHYAVPNAQPAAPVKRIDCGKIVLDNREPSYAELFADRCRIETAFQLLRGNWLRAEIARLEAERRAAEEMINIARLNGDARRYGSTGISAKRIDSAAVTRIIEAEKARRNAEREAK